MLVLIERRAEGEPFTLMVPFSARSFQSDVHSDSVNIGMLDLREIASALPNFESGLKEEETAQKQMPEIGDILSKLRKTSFATWPSGKLLEKQAFHSSSAIKTGKRVLASRKMEIASAGEDSSAVSNWFCSVFFSKRDFFSKSLYSSRICFRTDLAAMFRFSLQMRLTFFFF